VLLIGAALVVTAVLVAVSVATGALDSHASGAVRLVLLVVTASVNVALFAATFRLLAVREVAARDVLAGAVMAALCWQVLQAIGTAYVSRVVARSTDVYGVFGIVLGLFAWISLGASVTVLTAEVNVVRACRLWPRSLLAPFTDGRPLTVAHERAYVSYAQMRRYKRNERVAVSFDRSEAASRSAGRDR
jgi:uncharacterized BrkB/YihY/UPF0761 family membrane protein